MKIVIISDTHNKLSEIKVPDGDLLIHCGDFCGFGRMQELERFSQEFAGLPHKYKVVVAGNHDWPLEREHDSARLHLGQFHYLQDELVELAGLKIYGTPWQPTFMNWAFNLPRNSKHLKEKWEQIPAGLDILITHGPPYGVLDKTKFGQHVGCELLRERVRELKPRLHCFGHIHEAYGRVEENGTLFVNAAVLNALYRPANSPVVLELN